MTLDVDIAHMENCFFHEWIFCAEWDFLLLLIDAYIVHMYVLSLPDWPLMSDRLTLCWCFIIALFTWIFVTFMNRFLCWVRFFLLLINVDMVHIDILSLHGWPLMSDKMNLRWCLMLTLFNGNLLPSCMDLLCWVRFVS